MPHILNLTTFCQFIKPNKLSPDQVEPFFKENDKVSLSLRFCSSHPSSSSCPYILHLSSQSVRKRIVHIYKLIKKLAMTNEILVKSHSDKVKSHRLIHLNKVK